MQAGLSLNYVERMYSDITIEYILWNGNMAAVFFNRRIIAALHYDERKEKEHIGTLFMEQ